jgi:hypothetical protein
VYGHQRGGVMNAFVHLVDDHLVVSLGTLHIYASFRIPITFM